MITYEEAVRIVDEHASVLGAGVRPVVGSTGYFLAEDVIAKCDSPPFDNSAVDGYGRRAEDLSVSILPLIGEIRAGDDGSLAVPRRHAVRILTGAPVPPEIAAVSMQEDCHEEGGMVRFAEPSTGGEAIRRAGSDFRKGDIVLPNRTRMTPPSVGLAGSAGYSRIEYLIQPRVAIVTTGDELVELDGELGPGQIYNSNEGALCAAVQPLSARTDVWTFKDDPEQINFLLPAILGERDVLITCGGVSVGSHDYLKEAFRAIGVEEKFWSVAIKPGKPIYFGTHGKKLVFGLPGNPVSALVTFQLFVRPALLKMAGHPDPWPKPARSRFRGKSRKNSGRMEFLRGVVSEEGVRLAGPQGSHQLAALLEANCLIHFPLESSELRDGDNVDITPLNWGAA